MDEATLDHLFQPFFTTKGPARARSGTGYRVRHRAPVGGRSRLAASREWVRPSPYTAASQPDRRRGAGPPRATASGGKKTGRILVVEDDSGVRRFASRVLEAAGYEVLTAIDGASAIEVAAGANVQLVLTDVVMPGMSGRDVATALSASQPDVRFCTCRATPTRASSTAGSLRKTSPSSPNLHRPVPPGGRGRRHGPCRRRLTDRSHDPEARGGGQAADVRSGSRNAVEVWIARSELGARGPFG